MVYIYVLELEYSKYYIGKTNDPKRRLLEHCNSEGSAWTKLYKPIRIKQIIQDCSSFDEDKYTLEYMSLYGIENVRGGSFCSVELTNEDKIVLQRMIRGSLDKCFKCGNEGHFASDCKLNKKPPVKPYTKVELYSKNKTINNIRGINSRNNYRYTSRTNSPLTIHSRNSSPPPTHPTNITNIVNKILVPPLIKIKEPFIPELIKIDNPELFNIKFKHQFIPELIKMW